MPRISHVVWKKYGLDYGYMFDIQSAEELLDYWQVCRSGQIKEGVSDYLKCTSGKGHISTSYAAYLNTTALAHEGGSLADLVAHCENKLLTQLLRDVRERERIFINTNGGYFFMTDESFEVLHTCEVKKYIVPNGKITVTQWPGGEHYYARVDGEDVEVCGRRKWDTHKEAMSAALKFQQEA